MSFVISSVIDVRTIPPRERHPLIFGTFEALQPGQALQLVNDHDPEPLYHQLQARSPGGFEWSYIDAGPAVWRVQIGKLADRVRQARGDSCCSGGACCG